MFRSLPAPRRPLSLLTLPLLALVSTIGACGDDSAATEPDAAMGSPDGGASRDAGTGDEDGGTRRDGGPADAGATGDDAAMDDGGLDVDGATMDAAVLVVDDQTLPAPYQTLAIRLAELPPSATTDGEVRVRYSGGDRDGDLVGSLPLVVGMSYEDASMALDERIVGAQRLVATMVDGAGDPYLTPGGEPVQETFDVIGDSEDPVLVVESQLLAPGDPYGLEIAQVVVPERFTVGLWLAVYAEEEGGGFDLRGKQHFAPGEHLDTAFDVDSAFDRAETMHALLREPRPGSGSWDSSGDIITTISGQEIIRVFEVDAEEFRPVLEIEDQELTIGTFGDADLTVARVTMPEEYIGGGWLAIYTDNGGAPDQLIGRRKFNPGTWTDYTVVLDPAPAGDNTLHAALHVGQLWEDAQYEVMIGREGREVRRTFRVGAGELSYITASPYTTDDPRIVMVERAYSFDTRAWIVLYRDDGGSLGTPLAARTVPPRYAGNVWFHRTTGDFLESGTAAEFLVGDPGTYRRYVRGNETLHVRMYEAMSGDTTWDPGVDDATPVLDSGGAPVSALLDVTVASSIDNSQADSSRYYFPCSLSQYNDAPTSLPVDCRCHVNVTGLDFPECKSIIADYLGMSFGDGPRVDTLNFGRWRSGFSEPATGELIALAVWKDNTTVWPENGISIDVGAVMAIDAETRERRIIGGRYDDPVSGIVDVGTGPVLSHPFEVQKGPDGDYYIASYGYVRLDASLTPTVDIIRMDPDTGDREYVWRSNHLGANLDGEPNPYGHCGNGRTERYGYRSVQIGRKAFGIDGSGNFYLSYAHNGNTPTSDGIGIIRVGADGTSCDFVTRTGTGVDNVLYEGNDIGSGPEPQAGPYKGMLIRSGTIYTSTELTDELWAIDIATGDRQALHTYGVDDTNTGSSGTHVVWDPYRDLIWQAGFSSATLLYDPATDSSEPLWCPDIDRDYQGIACMKLAAWGNNGLLLERGLWMHPTSPDYVFVVNGAIIQRVDLASGNSEIFSY